MRAHCTCRKKEKVDQLRLKAAQEKLTDESDIDPENTTEEKLNSILDELLKENLRLEVCQNFNFHFQK